MHAHPLMWPSGQPRSKVQKRAQFKVSLAAARDDLYDELERLGATAVTISSNAKLNLNGQPSAQQPAWIPDTAVACYFTRKGVEMVLACDRWNTIGDNIRAIGLTVAALRGISRWGTTEMMDAAFTGFAALPAASSGAGWWDGLRVAPDAPWDVIEANYRRLVKQHHPDNRGDPKVFRALTESYEQAQKARAS